MIPKVSEGGHEGKNPNLGQQFQQLLQPGGPTDVLPPPTAAHNGTKTENEPMTEKLLDALMAWNRMGRLSRDVGHFVLEHSLQNFQNQCQVHCDSAVSQSPSAPTTHTSSRKRKRTPDSDDSTTQNSEKPSTEEDSDSGESLAYEKKRMKRLVFLFLQMQQAHRQFQDEIATLVAEEDEAQTRSSLSKTRHVDAAIATE